MKLRYLWQKLHNDALHSQRVCFKTYGFQGDEGLDLMIMDPDMELFTYFRARLDP